ncbi:MAG: ribosome small subunit-dependent GTPase A [Gaiellaceae bacterium]
MIASDLTLERLGWDDGHAAAFEPHAEEGLLPGRVAVQHRGAYDLNTAAGEVRAEPAGRLRHDAGGAGLPAAGDWVAFRPTEGGGHARIHAVLPRRTVFSRKAAWSPTEEQVLAANVDVAFLVTSLNQDLNARRLERYLTMAWESGAEPVVLLSKADLCEHPELAAVEVGAVALGVPVLVVSAVTGQGIEEIGTYVRPHRTGVLLGSSGVGKSTLVNALLGRELMEVKEIREDGRGRHTTTRRELVPMPGGGLLLDTPGIRELQLWDADEGIEGVFGDILELTARCRFADCAHETEPGCAVHAAIDDGRLSLDRLRSFRKLERELRALELKQDERARSNERRRRRVFARSLRRSAW